MELAFPQILWTFVGRNWLHFWDPRWLRLLIFLLWEYWHTSPNSLLSRYRFLLHFLRNCTPWRWFPVSWLGLLSWRCFCCLSRDKRCLSMVPWWCGQSCSLEPCASALASTAAPWTHMLTRSSSRFGRSSTPYPVQLEWNWELSLRECPCSSIKVSQAGSFSSEFGQMRVAPCRERKSLVSIHNSPRYVFPLSCEACGVWSHLTYSIWYFSAFQNSQ